MNLQDRSKHALPVQYDFIETLDNGLYRGVNYKTNTFKRIKEATVEMRTSRIKTLLGDIEDTSLVDHEREEPGS